MLQRTRPALVRYITGHRIAMAFVVAAVLSLAAFGFASRPGPSVPAPATDRILPPVAIVVPPMERQRTTAAPMVGEEPTELALDPNPFFVSPELGDDGNDGTTPERPWASLRFALDQLQAGHTLYLMDGTYSEVISRNFHYVMKNSGTPEAWIRIAAAPGQSPLLRAFEGTALEIQGNYVEVSGLTVQGEGFDEVKSFGVGLSVRRSHHVRLVNNTISAMPLAGISCIESSNLEILDNEIFENAFWSTSQGSGISIWHSVDWGQAPAADGYHDRILGNRIYRNENKVRSKWKNFTTITDGNGIIIDQNRDFNYTGRTLIANNIVFDNGGRGILVFESNRVDVMFNTTYHNGRTGELEGGPVELAAGSATDVRFLNNLAWALPSAPAFRAVRSSGIESGGNVLVTTNPSDHAGEQDLTLAADPGIVNPSIDENLADFTPKPSGMLVGRALPFKPSLPYDADGTVRDVASADVGAYEIDGG